MNEQLEQNSNPEDLITSEEREIIDTISASPLLMIYHEDEPSAAFTGSNKNVLEYLNNTDTSVISKIKGKVGTKIKDIVLLSGEDAHKKAAFFSALTLNLTQAAAESQRQVEIALSQRTENQTESEKKRCDEIINDVKVALEKVTGNSVADWNTLVEKITEPSLIKNHHLLYRPSKFAIKELNKEIKNLEATHSPLVRDVEQVKEGLLKACRDYENFSCLSEDEIKEYQALKKSSDPEERKRGMMFFKEKWNERVNREFIQSFKTVHWVSSLGDLEHVASLNSSTELSTMGYDQDQQLWCGWGRGIGLRIEGNVTCAGNGDLRSDNKIDGRKYPNGDRTSLILDKDTYIPLAHGDGWNEFMIDQWKPVEIVVDQEKMKLTGQDTDLIPLLDVAKRFGLRVIDTSEKVIQEK